MLKYYVKYIEIDGKQAWPMTIKKFDDADEATKYLKEIALIAMEYLASHTYFYPEQTVSMQGEDPIAIYLNGMAIRFYWVDADWDAKLRENA